MQENPCRVASKLIEHGRSTHLFCVESLKRGVLFPGLKKQGYDIRQVLDFPARQKTIGAYLETRCFVILIDGIHFL